MKPTLSKFKVKEELDIKENPVIPSMYTRSILPQLEKELYTKENMVITGTRNVGKTTILKYLFDKVESSNKVFIDLENILNRRIFEEENYDAIWSHLQPLGINKDEKSYIFLDEVQTVSNIASVVKYLSDHWDTKFFLTGSSSFYLRKLFSESMSGRKLIFTIYPLTFEEFLIFKGVNRKVDDSFLKKASMKNTINYERLIPYYREYMGYGGFPRVVNEPNVYRKKLILEEIFTSYFEKDVRQLADFKNINILRDLILLLVPRVGQRFEITKLASDLGVSRETVYSHLSFLEQTYFISVIPRFSGIGKQIAGNKKLFLCDTGIANVLGKISEDQLFEQSIFQNFRPSKKLQFYNKKGGDEIDFIMDGKIAIETKIQVSRNDINHVKQRSESLTDIKEVFAITLSYNEEKEVILATAL